MTDSNEIVPINFGDNDSDITPSDIDSDNEWREIVNQIIETLDTNDLPDDVIQATEYMIAGWPTYKIAKKLNTSKHTIRYWLSKYPAMAAAVQQGRELMSRWRLARLEQQFLLAVNRSEEILELKLNDKSVNPKILGLIAQHARFVIGLFAGKKIDINVKVEEERPQLKAKEDALQYLAEQLQKQRDSDEPIEATYRVVDPKVNEGPLLDENGEPNFGELGELDVNDDGVMCHICGKRFSYLSIHIRKKHHISNEIYEVTFMLERGAVDESAQSD